MNPATKADNRMLSILTVSATFLMGFIDAYTFIEKGGVFVSAQTGNMVVFSSKLFTGNFAQAVGHITVFAGFALGAFLGEAVTEKISGSHLKKFQVFLILQSLLLLFFAIFQQQITDSLMVFALGLLAGYELTIFRKIGMTTINDGIMTGNTKNLMNSLYKIVVDKDPTARNDFKELGLAILVFMIGVGAGSLVIQVKASLNLWCAFLMSVFLFFYVRYYLGTKQ